jgi:flagellar motor protein MotB
MDKDSDSHRVVQIAREAAQTAEDARAIAERRQQAEHLLEARENLSEAQAKLIQAQQAQERAIDAAQQARAEVAAARTEAQNALAARDHAEAEAQAARERADRSAKAGVSSSLQSARARQLRARRQLNEALSTMLPTLDTTRGLVASLSDDCFRGPDLAAPTVNRTDRVAAILAHQSGLAVSIEGYSAGPVGRSLSRERADAVRRELIARGVPAASLSAVGLGASRPLVSNSTAEGRRRNARVEIVISGNSIGRRPLWDQTYSLTGPK